MTCCFFGHRDTPQSVRPALEQTVQSLILQHGVTTFYVGNQGSFDRLALGALSQYKSAFPSIRCFLVLAYPPKKGDPLPPGIETLYPEGLETVPKRFAICRRNTWMVDHSDLVVTCISRPFGGAAQSAELARRRGKKIFPLLPPPKGVNEHAAV